MDEDRLAIRQLVENWVLWRDAGEWERFATVWDPGGGWMTATWFQGSGPEFVEASRRGFDSGVHILHFLGGHTSDVAGDRAVAETKMTINQRAEVHGVEVDVACTGRFHDFLARHVGEWKLARRQPIYEKDRMDRSTRRPPCRWTRSCWAGSRSATATSPTCRPSSGSRSGTGSPG